jgi:hypothetical protein
MPATPDYLASLALELSYRVRQDDPEDNGRWLAKRLPNPADWFRLAFVAAAAIPQDRTWRELTDWACQLPESRPDPPERPDRPERDGLQPCGTRAAYRRHLKRGEPTCQACRDASAAYKRNFLTDRRAS